MPKTPVVDYATMSAEPVNSTGAYVCGVVELVLGVLALGGASDEHNSWMVGAVLACVVFTIAHAIALLGHRRHFPRLMRLFTGFAVAAQLALVFLGVDLILRAAEVRQFDRLGAGFLSLRGRFVFAVALASIAVCIAGARYSRAK